VAAALRDAVGVALHQPDALVVDAEPIGQDLRKSSLVALADRLRAGDQCHASVRLEADIDILMRRAAGRLDVIGEAQPAPQAADLAVAAAGGETRDIGPRQREIETRRKIAAVDPVAKGVHHRHRRSRDEVLAAQFRPVETALRGGIVDQPLDNIDRLCKARPARHTHRRRVGEDPLDVQLDRRDAVDRPRQMHILEALDAAAADEIGAEIDGAGDPERQKPALGVER
jgi:hypothetical protein